MLPKRKYANEDIESDDSIYSEEGREILLSDDELSPMEEGFMQGYENAA